MAAPMNDPNIALAGMARIGNPRQPMGTEAYNLTGVGYVPSPNTTLVPRQDAQSGGLDGPGGSRAYGMYPLPAGMGDKDGAAYRTVTNFPPMPLTDPSAAQTQANGRILKGAIDRQVPNFGEAVGDSYEYGL